MVRVGATMNGQQNERLIEFIAGEWEHSGECFSILEISLPRSNELMKK